MLVMFYRYTKKPIWCFRGNPFDVLGVSGVVRCNCHNLNRSWRFFNITSMTLIRRWVMRRLIWVWNDFFFHWHDAAEVDGRRLLYINVLSNKLTHNIHCFKKGTSWLGYELTRVRVDQKGYELTKKGTSWLGYELTWVRVDQKPEVYTGDSLVLYDLQIDLRPITLPLIDINSEKKAWNLSWPHYFPDELFIIQIVHL